MKKNKRSLFVSLVLLTIILFLYAFSYEADDSRFLSYTADPSKQETRFYLNDKDNKPYGNFLSLKTALEKQHSTLLFAMNGGMYQTDQSPLGLYIENGKIIRKLNQRTGSGNFYLKPNGVFYITKNKTAFITTTEKFVSGTNIQYATQSGPMLVTDGIINPVFGKGSANINIRNGVGILPGNKVLYVMSKEPVNFYDFAEYFKKMGCINALYLDGFVSRTYLPGKNWVQTDGNFGVIIAVSE